MILGETQSGLTEFIVNPLVHLKLIKFNPLYKRMRYM